MITEVSNGGVANVIAEVSNAASDQGMRCLHGAGQLLLREAGPIFAIQLDGLRATLASPSEHTTARHPPTAEVPYRVVRFAIMAMASATALNILGPNPVALTASGAARSSALRRAPACAGKRRTRPVLPHESGVFTDLPS